MKPFEQLTRAGRLQRIRQLAETALEAYGLAGARLKLVRAAENTLYRVYDPRPEDKHTAGDLFIPGQYLLRIYQPGWQTPEAIHLELAWLAAMRHEADLPVPEPVALPDGSLLAQVSIPGVPEGRHCALLRWVNGRLLPGYGGPEHYQAQGRLMARLHNFSQAWQIPSSRSKRHYDWDGLFMNDAEIGLPDGACWKLLPPEWLEPFEMIAHQTRQLMSAWGKGPEVYGLIHADIGRNANLLFWHGKPRLIDFDSSGFGYWMYDLSISLEHAREDLAFPHYQDALLEGYTEHRSLPDEQVAQMELFLAAFSVYWTLWGVGVTHLHPQYTAELGPRIKREAAQVSHYLAGRIRS